MNVHYLQHVPFEGLGSIQEWLITNKYTITCTKFFENQDLPDPHSIDMLIILGGPMSVNDIDVYEWLQLEKEFVKQVIQLNKPVLGICLGAQVIANTMGAKVYPNTHKEIGWYDIQSTCSDDRLFCFPAMQRVFHWHGETYDLPDSAILLAKSDACQNQAFIIGQNVIGLQFHLETTPKSANDIVQHCKDELIQAKYVQSQKEILSVSEDMYMSINKLMYNVLDYLKSNR